MFHFRLRSTSRPSRMSTRTTRTSRRTEDPSRGATPSNRPTRRRAASIRQLPATEQLLLLLAYPRSISRNVILPRRTRTSRRSLRAFHTNFSSAARALRRDLKSCRPVAATLSVDSAVSPVLSSKLSTRRARRLCRCTQTLLRSHTSSISIRCNSSIH